jgi:hypothetical protein
VATDDRTGAPAPVADTRSLETAEEVIRARLSAALGGIRGSVETALPTVAFVGAWVWRHDVTTAVAASAVVVLVLLVSRLVARQTTRYVLSAVAATAVAAFFALRSGRAQDAFLPGILTSAAWGAAALVSVLARWPVVGFVVAAGDPRMADDPFGWRRDRGLVRVCQRLTMVLVGLYALRVAVMLPMYLAGEVTLLGIAKIVLGWPAYLAAVAVMGLVLMRGRTAPAPLPVEADAET